MNRTLKIILLALTALVVLALAGRWLWIVHARSALADEVAAFERDVGALDPALYVSDPPADADDNIARWLLEAGKAADLDVEPVNRIRDFSELRHGAWTPTTAEQASQLLAANGRALELAEKAAAGQACSFGIDYAAGADLAIPPVVIILKVTKLLQVDARAALFAGDHAAALERIWQLRAASQCLRDEPLLIFQLIGIAVEQQAQIVTSEIVEMAAVDANTLVALRWPGDRSNDHQQAVNAMAGEASLALSLAASLEGFYGRLLGPIVGRVLARGCLARYRLIVEHIGDDAPVDELDVMTPPLTRLGPWFEFLIPTPHVEGFVRRAKSVQAFRRLHDLALAVRLAGLEQGRYPATLDHFDGADNNGVNGEPISYRHDNGAVILEIEGATEAWATVSGETIRPLPSRWRLPPIEPPT